MGCDIHSYAEVRDENGRWYPAPERIPLDDWARKYYGRDFGRSPFDWRSYGLYGFLANVRNYSAVTPISEPRGMPKDASGLVDDEYEQWGYDAHSASWLTLAELLAVDYDASFEDRRVTRQVGPNHWDGGVTADPGEGEVKTLREFLGDLYFRDLRILKSLGDPERVRVVFWFDN